MSLYDFYQVDSFTNQAFKGNPAGVVILDKELSDSILQSIAKEINLSETAFVVDNGKELNIRWFTPETEVKLCGHGTLAASQVLFKEKAISECKFKSKSGDLYARYLDGEVSLVFPASYPRRDYHNVALKDLLPQVEAMKIADDLNYVLTEFTDRVDLIKFKPDYKALKDVANLSGLIITCRDNEYDFISRFFDPWEGILEDPVTGSAHCVLTPYWSERLNKKELRAYQASERGGIIKCYDDGDKVVLKGEAVIVIKGKIEF